MKKRAAELAASLARMAERDWEVASVILASGSYFEMVCFHLQQCAEKLLKALLTCRDIPFPRTHDLENLLTLAVRDSPQLAEFFQTLPNYSDFAEKSATTNPLRLGAVRRKKL